MCMPTVDPDLFMDAMKKLVLLDKDWIPKGKGTSLYIRPTMIATEPALGVHPANEYLFFHCDWTSRRLLRGRIQSHENLYHRRLRALRPPAASASAKPPRIMPPVSMPVSWPWNRVTHRCCGSTPLNGSMWKRWAPVISFSSSVDELITPPCQGLSFPA